MKTIDLAVLANVSGLAIAALALVFLSGGRRYWKTMIRSDRKWGLLCCVVAGLLLSLGGQLLLARRAYQMAIEMSPQAKVQAALWEPVEALSIRIHGPDPFRTVPEACVLRLIATTRAGRTVTSQVPRSRLSLSIPAAELVTARRDFREYTVLWQSVIEGATNEESRAVTGRIRNLNDLLLFDRIEAAIVLRSEKRIPLPDSLRISTMTDPPRELFVGAGTRDEVMQQGREWVHAYQNQAEWLRLSDRLVGWQALVAYLGPRRYPDLLESVSLGAGVLFLAVGIGLMLRRPGTRPDGPAPTSPDEAPDRASFSGSETREGPSPSKTPFPILDVLSSVVVWGTWAGMLIASLALVARYGSNHPWADDWFILPRLLGREPIAWSWLWEQGNGHRIPLPKLIHVALFRMTSDFRASMYFNVLVLGSVACAMIWEARRLRGRMSITDLFFPLVILTFAQSQTELHHSGVHYALASLFVGMISVLILRAGQRTSLGPEVGVGICLLLLPLCGGIALCFVPPVALWLGYAGIVRMRAPGSGAIDEWGGLLLFGLSLFALVEILGIAASTRVADELGTITTKSLIVTVQFLALGLGPAYSRFWPLSGAVIPILSVLTLASLVVVGLRRSMGRVRVLGVISLLAGMAILTLVFALLRAGGIPGHELLGRDHVHALRYITLAVPLVCAIYLSWSLTGPPALARSIQAGLFLLALVMAPTNAALGLDWGRGLRQGFEAVEADIKAGLPAYKIFARHRDSYSVEYSTKDSYFIEIMQEMQAAGIGLYRHLKPNPPLRRVSLPLTPCSTPGIEMDPEPGKGRVSGPDGYLAFCLPRATTVGLIRFRAAHSDPANRVRIGWKKSAERESSPRDHMTGYFNIGDEVIAVADMVEEFRIYPGNRPGDFQISNIELLAPVNDEEATAPGGDGRQGLMRVGGGGWAP
jgi:hypothetical protein